MLESGSFYFYNHKEITLKEFLSVFHFISYQHRTEIHTFLNLTELFASNRIKETYSYYFYLEQKKKENKFKSNFFLCLCGRYMFEFCRRNLMIFIIQGFQTVIFIFIVIFSMFCPK